MKGVFDFLGDEGFGAYEFADGQAPRRVTRTPHGTLVPGFVDIHVHGGFGLDFMTSTTEEIITWCESLKREGYEAFLPTTVTATPEAIRAALDRLPDHPLIGGFHLEGPFISPVFPGAQPPSAIASAPVDSSDWDAILEDPRLRVVTIAPEIPFALPLITRLMSRGVVVSMGHTNATYAEAKAGFECGACHCTHMYNAMRPLHHREAGMVGYALSNDSLYTELIYDRNHVCREAAGILFKCKPADRVIAVSDGTRAIAMPPGSRFEMWGLSVVVGKREVRLENGTLAGSAITLLDAFKNLFEDFGPETAIRACCLNPRQSIGMFKTPQVYLEFDHQLRLVARHEGALPSATETALN